MSAEMTDRELLELAAKAAGLQVVGGQHPHDGLNIILSDRVFVWRPLTDDGDALRLAVKLEMLLDLSQEATSDGFKQHHPLIANAVCNDKANPCAATRRAIVRAAAEIGRAMK